AGRSGSPRDGGEAGGLPAAAVEDRAGGPPRRDPASSRLARSLPNPLRRRCGSEDRGILRRARRRRAERMIVVETVTLDERAREGPWDEMIGRTAGSFRIIKLLGKGGMGAVYLARHPGIGSEVAVKFLHPRFSSDKQHVERFFNEARAVNLIGHENIVKTLDFSVTPDGLYYCVMELLQGQPLSSLLRVPVPLAVAGPILVQCCRALQAAHERQI